ncbi:hypothetical protein [Hymenobacter canadensis]|uniref:Uncharacterized protein n=1 Tax=Hymenobacter canadensis TaxID=2999067 RepID=A0ABY7LXE5_9BACT|nr:hypothetical protein [Hymenobacter canadensis]WBA43598.1 hypothetical protein O3303_08525 [Hymenobacter canadensis]
MTHYLNLSRPSRVSEDPLVHATAHELLPSSHARASPVRLPWPAHGQR